MAYMTERCQAIVNMLLASDSWLTLSQIETTLNVSRRSIYYDLCRINDWLVENDMAELEVVRGKGIYITEDLKNRIEEIKEDSDDVGDYVYSPMERVHLIICSIIFSKDSVYIEQLMDYCMVSRNTIFNDLRVVASQLQDYNLELLYEAKQGYYIDGDTIKIRALYLQHVHELEKNFEEKMLPFMDKEEFQTHYNALKEVEKALNIQYVRGTLRALATLIPVMLRTEHNLSFPKLKMTEIESTREWQEIGRQFAEMDEKERVYLCLHFLGSRVAVASNDIFEEQSDQTVYEITKALVAEFEKKACVIFKDKEELERQLFVHINSSLYRYQYGIWLDDSVCDDIIREYPDLFEITKLVSRYLEQQIGLPIPESEIAYLALHFGAHLSAESSNTSRLRIMIICVNGISTGNMLKREVSKLLPQVEIIGVYPLVAVQNVQDICDLIITTVKIKCIVPSIQVHPILTDYDRNLILNHPKIRAMQGRVDVERLMKAMEPYIAKGKKEEALRTLKEYFKDTDVREDAKKRPESLADALNMENIAVRESQKQWTGALWEAGEPLVKRGSVEKEYIDRIISQIRYYGPYMFITPRVILAHAKPEDGVNRLDVSFFVYKQAVKFSDFHEANIVIVLAAEDQEKHLKILRDIASIFSIQARIDDILALNST